MFTQKHNFIYNMCMTDVVIESLEKLTGLLPGLFQFENNDYFKQAELAISDDGVFIYDDHAPSEIVDGILKFYIKTTIPFADIRYLMVQKLKNPEFDKYDRIVIVLKGKKKDPLYFYYVAKEKKLLKQMIKLFKKKRKKIKKDNIFIDIEKENSK